MKENWQKYMAEALGTAAFVFAAAGSVLVNRQTGGLLGTVGVALVHGLMLAAMIYATWHISGAHFNPAVTIAVWATGRMKALVALGYIIAQLIGGIAAGLLLKTVFVGASPQFYLGSTILGSGVNTTLGIFIEALFTFFLVWTIFGAAVDKKSSHGFGGLAIGAVLAVAIMLGGELTMSSLNPARSFGPALVSSYWENHYVYWAGPIVGALLAAFVYEFAFKTKE